MGNTIYENFNKGDLVYGRADLRYECIKNMKNTYITIDVINPIVFETEYQNTYSLMGLLKEIMSKKNSKQSFQPEIDQFYKKISDMKKDMNDIAKTNEVKEYFPFKFM